MAEIAVYWAQGKEHPIWGAPPRQILIEDSRTEYALFITWITLYGPNALTEYESRPLALHNTRLHNFIKLVHENASFILELPNIHDPLASAEDLFSDMTWPPKDLATISEEVPMVIRAFGQRSSSAYSYEHYKDDVDQFVEFIRGAKEENKPASQIE